MSTYRKKLIEVSMPLAEIGDACAREKDIHVGMPPNLHAWWSRKPLAAARAVIVASILDDPGGHSEASRKERARLLDLVARAADPDLIDHSPALAALRTELTSAVPELPEFWDPFCGGGSIPLEAARLGLRTNASDLNPVAALICKVMLELVPKASDASRATGHEFAELVERYAKEVGAEAERRIGRFFPEVEVAGSGSLPPIAWVWVRTVECPNPPCRAAALLANKFWLSTHSGNEAWAEPVYNATRRAFDFRVHTTGTPPAGTVGPEGAKCLACGSPIPLEHIRKEGRASRLSASAMAVVVAVGRRRVYLPLDAAQQAAQAELPECWVPDTSLPEKALGFRVQNYGLTRHADLFSRRQLVTVSTFADIIRETFSRIEREQGNAIVADAVCALLAFALDRLAQSNCALVRWQVRKSGTSKGNPPLGSATLPMSWEFSEGNPFGKSVGSWEAAVKNVLGALPSLPTGSVSANVVQSNAASPSETTPRRGLLISTDPPYFDSMGYADLSDFFYVWLRRSLGERFSRLFATMLVPKSDELIAASHLFGGDKRRAENHFEEGLQRAFKVMAERASPNYPVTVYYAFKQSESDDDDDDEGEAADESAAKVASTGWEKLLSALLSAGFSVTGTLPLRTERRARMRAIRSNALASSICLTCRVRPATASTSTRGEFRRLLRAELPQALKDLQQGNIAPVDVAQASIGPGMEIFSRHKQVLEADGKPMTVRAALQLINEVLDEYLASGEGDFDADTRFAITWYEQHGWEPGAFGDAETLAKARNVSVDGVEEAGIVKKGGGKVRILKRSEMRPLDYDPAADERPTVWEFTQHMIRSLEEDGEQAAARLLKKLGSAADATRELAYRLYNTCERKKWAEDARSYNALILAWTELEKLAAKMGDEAPPAAQSKPSKGRNGKKKPEKATKAPKKGQQALFEGDD
jgi:putative DNA methylase